MALNDDPLRLSDGLLTTEGGVNSGRNPQFIDRNQVAWSENVTHRGGSPVTRPGFRQLTLSDGSSGTLVADMVRESFQGADFYQDSNGIGYLMVSAGGRVFRMQITGRTANCDEITIAGDPNNSQAKIVYSLFAGNWFIIQDGSSFPFLWDGSNARRATINEIPIGSGPMAFGMGRIWVAQGREFVAGDIEGGDTDIISFTENTYLNEGGKFAVPLQSGNITSMIFTAAPNTALGQGELLIGTKNSMHSVVLPADRDSWKNLVDPVRRIVLINNGSASHAATVLVNGDVYIRSADGIRSVIYAVRDFSQPGNVPMSTEMHRTMIQDDESLIRYSSGILFDNRLLITTLSHNTNRNTYFSGLAVLDFDLISGMKSKQPPAWEGVWTGLQFLKLVKGEFAGRERAFAFARNPNDMYLYSVIVRTEKTITGTYGNATITISDEGATSPAVAAPRLCVSSQTIHAGGSGYVVGDVLTLVGPTPNDRQASWVVTTVSGGAVTGVSLIHGGIYQGTYGTPFSSTVHYATTTTGSGTGCQLDVVPKVFAVAVTFKGYGYPTKPTLSLYVDGVLQTGFSAVPVMDCRWELWEISKDLRFDYYIDDQGLSQERRPSCILESASYSFAGGSSSIRDNKRLIGAELGIHRICGQVDFSIQFRPDQFPCWNDWFSWQVNALYKDCGTVGQCLPKLYKEQHRPQIGVPMPPDVQTDDPPVPLTIGKEFQVRLMWDGFCQIRRLEVRAQKINDESPPPFGSTVEVPTGLTCPCDGSTDSGEIV